MSAAIVLYMPVIHQGYLDFITRNGWARNIYLLDQTFVKELTEVVEIRALEAQQVKMMLAPILKNYEIGIKVMDNQELLCLRGAKGLRQIITADEALTRRFVDKYLAGLSVRFDSTFLRWDENNVFSCSDVPHDRVSTDPVDRERMRQAEGEAEHSSDWWRHVGGALVVDGRVFTAKNTHVPSEYTPYINGDPRDSIRAGTHSEFSSTLHTEKGLFAEVLRSVISGADLYTTTFPCPDCAKLIAYSGVKRLFFKTGHSSLDGVTVLKARGVEIIKVE